MKMHWIPTFDQDTGWMLVPLRDITAFAVRDYNDKPKVFTKEHGWLFVEYPPSLSALWKLLEELNANDEPEPEVALAPAPALTDTAAKVVEAAEMWSQKPRTFTDIDHLEYAVRAHLAAKQGGAS